MGKIDIFAPQDTNMVKGLEGQKILLYGGNDTGKTYQGTRLPKPMLLMAEAGGNARTVTKFPINEWNDFTQIVDQLVKNYDKAREQFQTIVIDTDEALVATNEDGVAKMYGVAEVGMVQDAAKGNPNGYALSRSRFKNQINRLARQGYTVVFISHEMLDDTEGSPTYGKIIPYGSNKEKGSTKFIRDLCDFVIYTYANGVDAETGQTIYSSAICKETDKVFARSRYPMMQTYIKEFTAENLTQAIEDAIAKTAEDEGAGLVSFKEVDVVGEYTKDDYIQLLQPYVAKLFKLYPDYVAEQVESQLGVGNKITEATEEQVSELGALYATFVDFCTQRRINI